MAQFSTESDKMIMQAFCFPLHLERLAKLWVEPSSSIAPLKSQVMYNMISKVFGSIVFNLIQHGALGSLGPAGRGYSYITITFQLGFCYSFRNQISY